jgi:putative DNA primase/helicase
MTIAKEGLALSDVGNAYRFERRAAHSYIYIHGLEQWFRNDGRRWTGDTSRQVFTVAVDTARAILAEAADETDDARRRELVKHALLSQRNERLNALLSIARTFPTFARTSDQLDHDQLLFNVENGTIDLRNGRLLEHAGSRLITKLCRIPYDSTARCPTWSAFLERVLPNEQVRYFVQRAVGYSLTGDVSEQCLFFLYGTGKNGKSTFLETLRMILGEGEYCKAAAPDLLLAKKFDRHAAELADLRGARFVTTIEAGEGRAWDEARLKWLTGGDAISARFMYGNPFTFQPSHKFWVAANHRPRVSGTDEGFWRRIRLIPFTVTISEDERDPHLKEKLIEEAPGILAWAVNGALAWQTRGLAAPADVSQATDEYRASEDVLAAYIADRCTLIPAARTTLQLLYEDFQQWAEATGERPLRRREFGDRLEERFPKGKSNAGVMFEGVALKANVHPMRVSA